MESFRKSKSNIALLVKEAHPHHSTPRTTTFYGTRNVRRVQRFDHFSTIMLVSFRLFADHRSSSCICTEFRDTAQNRSTFTERGYRTVFVCCPCCDNQNNPPWIGLWCWSGCCSDVVLIRHRPRMQSRISIPVTPFQLFIFISLLWFIHTVTMPDLI